MTTSYLDSHVRLSFDRAALLKPRTTVTSYRSPQPVCNIATPPRKMLVQHSNKATHGSTDKSLSTSRSMPSLGTTSRAPRVVLRSRGDGERSPDGDHESSFRDEAVANEGASKQRPYAPEDDCYMSSTQMAYLSGEMQPQPIPMRMRA